MSIVALEKTGFHNKWNLKCMVYTVLGCLKVNTGV